MEVPFPFTYLVSEWITILAPCSIGFTNALVATVLSTMNGIFASLATVEMAFRSNTSNLDCLRTQQKLP